MQTMVAGFGDTEEATSFVFTLDVLRFRAVLFDSAEEFNDSDWRNEHEPLLVTGLPCIVAFEPYPYNESELSHDTRSEYFRYYMLPRTLSDCGGTRIRGFEDCVDEVAVPRK
jgi:hypothetical protein